MTPAKTYGRPRPLPKPVADRALVYGLACIAVPFVLGALLWLGILELALHAPLVLAFGVAGPLIVAYGVGWLRNSALASRPSSLAPPPRPGRWEGATEVPRSVPGPRTSAASTHSTGRSAGSSGSPALPQKPVAH